MNKLHRTIMMTGALVAASSAPLLAQTPPPQPGTTVYDARGKFIGKLVSQDYVERYIPSAGTWIGFSFTAGGFIWDTTPYLTYKSSDCSGQSYLGGRSLPVVSQFTADATQPHPPYVTEGTLWFGGAPVAYAILNSYSYGGVCHDITAYPLTGFVGPMKSIRISGYFTGPFTLK